MTSGHLNKRPRRALFFGTYERARLSRITAMLEGISDHGIDVVECNVPLPLTHDARLHLLRRPWKAPFFLWTLVRTWWNLARYARGQPVPDFIVVPYMGQFDVLLARACFPRTPIVLDQMVFLGDTIRDRQGPTLLAVALDLVDHFAMAVANVVAVDTEEHRTMVPARLRAKAVVVPVGVPRFWARHGEAPPAAELDAEYTPSIVFFGLFTPLQGTAVLAKALKELSQTKVRFRATLVGHGQDYEVVRSILEGVPEVAWVRWLDETQLRQTLSTHDICLGIFGATPKARRVVPQKIPMGAAAGCAIVTAGTAPQRRALGDAAVFVPEGDNAALADALQHLLNDPVRLAALKAAARKVAETRFSGRETVRDLVERLTPA